MGMHRPLILLALALAAPAFAQDSRVWNFDDNPDAPALGFGAPDSDDILIGFSCEPSTKQMTIVESIASTKVNPGAGIDLCRCDRFHDRHLLGAGLAREADQNVV